MRTSYSALATYKQCPQKYKFQEIDKIRLQKSFEAKFGTLVHETLKFMFERTPLYPTLDEVIMYFREHWPSREMREALPTHDPLKIPLSPDEERLWQEEGIRMIKRFYEKNAPWNFSVLDLETRFEIAITDETRGETHMLAGIIDRIDKLGDGTYEIIDYKTARRMPSQEAVDNDLQLSLYALGMQHRWPHLTPETIKLSLYFLKHGEKLSTTADKEKMDATKNDLLDTINDITERIREKKSFEPVPSALCGWCEYRPLCPAWKHLYKKFQSPNSKSQNEMKQIVKEYFELKKIEQQNETRRMELQNRIKEYMEQEGVTRLFGDDGVITQRTIERFEYDWEKIKALLSPLGKWEAVRAADETRLHRILPELPKTVRDAIKNARHVSKTYRVLAVTKKPEDMPPAPI